MHLQHYFTLIHTSFFLLCVISHSWNSLLLFFTMQVKSATVKADTAQCCLHDACNSKSVATHSVPANHTKFYKRISSEQSQCRRTGQLHHIQQYEIPSLVHIKRIAHKHTTITKTPTVIPH